jgi:hypothetical protein
VPHLGLLTFWTLPILQCSKEHIILGTGSASILWWKGGRHLLYQVQWKKLTSISGLRRSESESESYVTTDGQPASLSWNKAPFWGLRPDLYYMCDSYGLVLVERSLWREVRSVFCMCCWPLPALSFSGPSPLGLETIFYCLRFETTEVSITTAIYIPEIKFCHWDITGKFRIKIMERHMKTWN